MDLSIFQILARIAIGAIIGFFIGLTGIGGGVLVIPTLSLLLGLPPSVAVGTTSLYAFISQVLGAIRHISLKNVDFKVYPFLILGALPGNIAVSTFINRYLKRHADDTALIDRFQDKLGILIASVIVLSAGILIISVLREMKGEKSFKKTSLADVVNKSVLSRLIAGLFFGSLVGAIIGSTSVGGGVILVPTLISIFGLTANRTVGTSLTIGSTLTLATALVFGRGGQMDMPTALFMAAGSLISVHFGSKLAATMPAVKLKLVMVAMVIAAGIMMLIK